MTCLPAASAASASGRWRWFGRADVDDVDVVGLHELLGAGERALDAQLGRGLLGAGGRGGRDADDVGAGEARGADMDGADEAGAGDGDAKRVRSMAADRMELLHVCQAKDLCRT